MSRTSLSKRSVDEKTGGKLRRCKFLKRRSPGSSQGIHASGRSSLTCDILFVLQRWWRAAPWLGWSDSSWPAFVGTSE